MFIASLNPMSTKFLHGTSLETPRKIEPQIRMMVQLLYDKANDTRTFVAAPTLKTRRAIKFCTYRTRISLTTLLVDIFR